MVSLIILCLFLNDWGPQNSSQTGNPAPLTPNSARPSSAPTSSLFNASANQDTVITILLSLKLCIDAYSFIIGTCYLISVGFSEIQPSNDNAEAAGGGV